MYIFMLNSCLRICKLTHDFLNLGNSSRQKHKLLPTYEFINNLIKGISSYRIENMFLW
jgi:hypothetical protein